MKKLSLLLLLVSLTRIGVAYADTTNPATSQDYFFGTKQAAANLNQVLALLVGPKGDPGPAGVAGKDGLIGLNGVDGLDGAPGVAGLNGKDGVDGKDGVSVASAAFAGAQGTCTNGGTKFTDALGTITYACNGTNGAPGTPGTPGAPGAPGAPGGGSGGGSSNLGQGVLSITGCESDTVMTMMPTRKFTGSDFVFSSILLGDQSSSTGRIENTCAGQTTSFYFSIDSTHTPASSAYAAGEIIKCSAILPNVANWSSNSPWQYTFLPSAIWLGSNSGSTRPTYELRTRCYKNSGAGSEIELDSINTKDYINGIGFEIAP